MYIPPQENPSTPNLREIGRGPFVPIGPPIPIEPEITQSPPNPFQMAHEPPTQDKPSNIVMVPMVPIPHPTNPDTQMLVPIQPIDNIQIVTPTISPPMSPQRKQVELTESPQRTVPRQYGYQEYQSYVTPPQSPQRTYKVRSPNARPTNPYPTPIGPSRIFQEDDHGVILPKTHPQVVNSDYNGSDKKPAHNQIYSRPPQPPKRSKVPLFKQVTSYVPIQEPMSSQSSRYPLTMLRRTNSRRNTNAQVASPTRSMNRAMSFGTSRRPLPVRRRHSNRVYSSDRKMV